MKKRLKNWLVGTGVLAAGAVAMGAAAHTASRYMVGLAMDRKGAEKLEENLQKISGSVRDPALTERMEQAKLRLENAGCVTVGTKAADGITLVGHWRECPGAKRILIAMHGWRSCWSRDFGMVADFWQEERCSVLYPEQRAHGESGGEYLGFGMLERHDCKRWVEWVCRRNPMKLPVYLAGISMGASTVLMAGGMELPREVCGIIADCGFTSPRPSGSMWRRRICICTTDSTQDPRTACAGRRSGWAPGTAQRWTR